MGSGEGGVGTKRVEMEGVGWEGGWVGKQGVGSEEGQRVGQKGVTRGGSGGVGREETTEAGVGPGFDQSPEGVSAGALENM